MELLFVALAGAILGLGARYLLPNRHTHGSALIPAVGVSVACVLWVALTWAGLALLGTAAIVVAADLVVGRVRAAHDEKLFHTLNRGAATH